MEKIGAGQGASVEHKFSRVALENLEESRGELVRQILPKIERGEYGVIIGDDCTGRIPALIMREVVSAIYERRGYPAIETRFFAGKRGLYSQHRESYERKVERYLQSVTGNTGENRTFLIVTDVVPSGKTLTPITRALKRLGILFDVATIGICGSAEEIQEKLGASSVYFCDRDIPDIYSTSDIKGVYKDATDDTLFSKRMPGETTETVRMARIDAHVIAQRLIKKFVK